MSEYQPKKSLPRRRREVNINLGLEDIVWKGINWIHIDQGRDH
jgi:hypothetical protein